MYQGGLDPGFRPVPSPGCSVACRHASVMRVEVLEGSRVERRFWRSMNRNTSRQSRGRRMPLEV
jgi:hypothetical protein